MNTNILGVVLLLLILLILLYFIWYKKYNNNVLDLIATQENWYYNNKKINVPYSFRIKDYLSGKGNLEIAYFDSLGGYLQGIVIFDAKYQVIDNNNVQINPTSLISSATKRWPSNQIWKLSYIDSSNLNLKIGDNNLSLTKII